MSDSDPKNIQTIRGDGFEWSGIATQPQPIVFFLENGSREMLRVSSEGFFVEGRKVTDDTEVYQGFKSWLEQGKVATKEAVAPKTSDEATAAQQRLQANPVRLGVYRHHKGGHYLVFACSLDESSLTELVHYFSQERKTCWTRTRKEFFETVVTASGFSVSRFEFVCSAAAVDVASLASVLRFL